MKCKHMCRMNPRAHGLKQRPLGPPSWTIPRLSERNLMAITLNMHTKSRTICGKTCGVFWEQVSLRTLQEINLRVILYE